jgi:hypothetical protein
LLARQSRTTAKGAPIYFAVYGGAAPRRWRGGLRVFLKTEGMTL